ncbi:MAG TPA: ABC transporter permease [Candidatus Acidoferrales bacterium]
MRLRKWFLRFAGVFNKNRDDRDLAEEFESHLQLHIDDNLQSGMSPAEARRQALLKFGGVESAKEAYRDRRGLPFLEIAVQDFRFAFRSLRKNSGFAAVAVLTLALGIGANTAIFTVVNSVLLRPLPYAAPENLLTLNFNQSLPDLEDIRARARSFDSIGANATQSLDYTGGSDPIQIHAILSDAQLFTTLGARPLLGRLIAPGEDQYGSARVVLLSHAFWTQCFAADPAAIGKFIPLSGSLYQIIGVMPADFWLQGKPADVYASLRVVYPAAARERGVHFMNTYLRLKPRVTVAQAQSEMAGIDQALAQQYPAHDAGRVRRLIPLLQSIVGDSRPTLLILLSAVGLVLLISCVNFASLLLARAASRHREIVIRSSLGAGTVRLIGQMLAESLLLSLLGGAAGLLLAAWGIKLLLWLKPENLPRLATTQIDGRVLAFTFFISLFTGIVFGLIPAIHASRLDLNSGLKEAGRSGAGGTTSLRLRRLLVVTELSLAIVLLIGAGLLLRSFARLASVPPGVAPENIVTMRVELPATRYEKTPPQLRFRTALLESLNALPAVQAAMISELPMGGETVSHDLAIASQPSTKPGDEPEAEARSVLGDYFQIMGVPILQGRTFDSGDRTDSPAVAVVNQTFARRFFPNQNPVGQRIGWAHDDPPNWKIIIGVAGDVKHFGLDQPEKPAVYDLYSQNGESWKRWMTLVLRSPRDPADVIAAAKTQIWALDKSLPPTDVRTMDAVISLSTAPQKFNLTLLAIFAAIALALAAIGVFGVVSYSVTQRTQEFGIRLALGAQRADIFRLTFGEAARLAVAGSVIGLAGAAVVTRFMSTLLFGVSPHDPLTFIFVAAFLLAVAAAACIIPARRAVQVDPITALRYE